MELIAKKTFRGRNSRLIKKGERFTVDPLLGRVYLAVGHAEHPPREVAHMTPPLTEGHVRKGGQNSTPSQVVVRPEAPSPIPYNTRMMTADAPRPRRGGRRKKSDSE